MRNPTNEFRSVSEIWQTLVTSGLFTKEQLEAARGILRQAPDVAAAVDQLAAAGIVPAGLWEQLAAARTSATNKPATGKAPVRVKADPQRTASTGRSPESARSETSEGPSAAIESVRLPAAPAPSSAASSVSAGIRVRRTASSGSTGAAGVARFAGWVSLWRNTKSRRLLLASAGLLMLVAIAGGVSMWFARGGDEVAAGSAGSVVASEEAAATPATVFNPNDPDDPENRPDPPVVPAVDSAVAAAEAAAVAAASPVPAAPAATSGFGGGISGTSGFGGTGLSPTASPTPAAAPAGAPAALAPPAASVATPAAAAPGPSATPAPASAPAPAPAKAVPVRAEFAAAIDLVPVPDAGASASETQVLGRIQVGPDDSCYLALLGGEQAVRGKTGFQLRNADGGTAARQWEVVMNDGAGAEAVVATMALVDAELRFAWTDAAQQQAAATALRNCVLQVAAGPLQPKSVALRAVQKGPAIALAGLEKGPLNAKAGVEYLPDTLALRMEATVPGEKVVFESAGNVDVTKADQWLYLAETEEKAVLRLKIETSVTPKQVQVQLTPFVHLGGSPQRLTPALRKKLSLTELQKQREVLLLRSDQLKKNAPKQKNPAYDAEVENLRQASASLESSIQTVQALETIINKLPTLRLQVRFFHDVEGTPVDLIKLASPGKS